MFFDATNDLKITTPKINQYRIERRTYTVL